MKRLLFLALLLAAGKKETPAPSPTAAVVTDTATHAKDLMNQYTCVGCHVIPGVQGGGNLGPSLEHWGSKQTIINKFPNTEQSLMQWLVSPQSLDPNTTMPA